ncbi:methyltransferase [Nannocystaceae bacterium ST9]
MAEADEDDALYDAIGAYVVPQLLYVAATLELADHLRDAPLDLDALVERSGANPDALARVLRALVGLGIFARSRVGLYRLERAAEPLLRDHPRSRRAAILYAGDLQHRAWGSVMHSLQTGRSAFEHAFGQGIREHLASDEQAMRVAEEVRLRRNAGRNRAIADVIPLERVQTIADVGGGSGELLIELLRRNPSARGILIELPEVAARAHAHLAAQGFADRIDVVAGDAREGVRVEADIALIAEVVHCMDDADAAALLRRCPGKRVYVAERVLPPAGRASAGVFADLHMLVMFGGRERTRGEFSRVFESAGLRVRRVLATQSWVSVLEAIRSKPSTND